MSVTSFTGAEGEVRGGEGRWKAQGNAEMIDARQNESGFANVLNKRMVTNITYDVRLIIAELNSIAEYFYFHS